MGVVAVQVGTGLLVYLPQRAALAEAGMYIVVQRAGLLVIHLLFLLRQCKVIQAEMGLAPQVIKRLVVVVLVLLAIMEQAALLLAEMEG